MATIFRFADVEVREREFSLTKAGERLAVEPKAFRVLLILLRNPGKLIPKQELLDAVWGDAAVTENSLARAVALLRKHLGDEARTPKFIETVATVGYRFLGSVEAVEEPAAAAPPPDTMAPGPPRDRASIAPVRIAAASGRKILAVAGAVTLLFLSAAFWYLSRPLPPPRISSYTQITHDGRAKTIGGTDGSRLYFTQASPLTVVQVGVNGGDVVPVPLAIPAMQTMLMDVSPDGSSLLLQTLEEGHSANPMWVAPILGGAARRLGEGEVEAFSPDGLSVIYWTFEGDIFLARIDGTEKRKLVHVPSRADSFSWSPDRKAIRLISDGMLWEMSAGGAGLHRLLPDWKEPGTQSCGTWTADGRFYLFDLDSPSTGSQIWALDERQRLFGKPPARPIRLTSGPVRWGPLVPGRDATKVFAEGVNPRGELSRVDSGTGDLHPFLGGISADYIAFSPDGKSIAYVSFPERELWKADRDGSNRVRLSGPPEQIANPRWSPDSKQIAYFAFSLDGHIRMYLVSPDGGKPQRLLPEDEADLSDVTWSPDGKRVLFFRGNNNTDIGDLCILDLASGQVSIVPGSSNVWSPRWSPDGRYIVGIYSDQRAALPVFDFQTQKWSTLPVEGNVEFPSFSHDNRYVYFLRFEKNQGVFRVPLTGGKEERVADLSRSHITGFYGFSMSLDPTDAPLVLRDTGTDDIYALTLEEK